MKIKLDENLPLELMGLLSSHGHDVDTVPGEKLAGRDDSTIFSAAVSDERLLMTLDLDFSDVRKFRPGTHPGLVLIRLKHPSRRNIIQRMHQVLLSESLDDWKSCFVVVGENKLRIRRP